MVDIEKIKSRIAEINESLEKIRKYASLSNTEFWNDERNILSVKHLLLVCIEACGTICVHISAKKLHKAASSFTECFEILQDGGIVNKDLAEKLRNMARFRNILVHHYWKIDDEKVLEYARNNLEDFSLFLKAVVMYLGI